MSWPAALITALLLALYLRSPIDLVPDRLGPIGLLDDLIVLLVAIWWLRGQLGRPRAGPRRDSARAGSADRGGADDPYGVLGIGHDASREEITRAYREQMKLYHPDRVAGLGEELQRVAHEKTVAIQRAYEALGKP